MQGMAACKHPQGREEEKEEEEDEEGGGFHTGSRCVSSFENKYWKYFSLPVLVWVDFILDLYKLSTIAAPRDLKLCFKRKEKEKNFFFCSTTVATEELGQQLSESLSPCLWWCA